MQNQLVKKLLYRTPFASISSIYRLFSTSLPSAEAITENRPIKSSFAVQYLVESCGNLRSPAKPDSVLQFLRQIGLGDADIRRAVTTEPRILCSSLEKTIKPRVMEIREIGFSPSQVARLVPLILSSLNTENSSLRGKIEFWTPYLGSLEGIVSVLKGAPYLLTTSVKNVVDPNISFFQGQCGVSPNQIGKMMMRNTVLFTQSPNRLIAKIKNVKKIGFSKAEIDAMIAKQPMLLTNSDEGIQSSVGFLTGEAGLDLPYISHHPILLSFSLERRLIPRHYVMKSLKSKSLHKNICFSTFMRLSVEKFANKFVKTYKDIIPEAIEAYEAARASGISLKGNL